MVKNVTNLTIMNEDLHVFILQDLNSLGQSESTPSFEIQNCVFIVHYWKYVDITNQIDKIMAQR